MSYDLLSTSIKFVRLNKIRITFTVNTEILKYNLQYLCRTEIIALYIYSNRLQLFELGALNMLLKTLENISAGDNQFTFGKYIGDNSSCGKDSHYLRQNINQIYKKMTFFRHLLMMYQCH